MLVRLREVAAQAGIEPLLGRETSALSGGERQLLAVAGILMMRPRLYVVDEPLANLDPATAERLLAILRDLADAGNAVVIVEHRVEEALDLRPDKVLYLEEGDDPLPRPGRGFLRDRRPAGGQVAIRHRPRSAPSRRRGSSSPWRRAPSTSHGRCDPIGDATAPPRVPRRRCVDR